MKTTIKLAVASALVAAASSANAGIVIPAGDWTLDIGGVVNAYYTSTSTSGDFEGGAGAVLGGNNSKGNSNNSEANITTGLLPNYLSVSGKTRQNDLDVAFTISINPGASTKNSGIQGSNQENRQAFLTFGDKSWGSIKLGKDLGIYASDAILNDMTLLGVGSGAGFLAGNTTTLGRIGTGFMYADWKSQIAYSSPNWNGFSFTVGLTQAWDALAANDTLAPIGPGVGGKGTFNSATSTGRGGSQTAYEGKASYEWAGDVSGKVWAGFIYQKLDDVYSSILDADVGSTSARGFDVGANVNVAGFGLTGYYYDGKGIGTTGFLNLGLDGAGNRRDSNGGYV